MESLLEHSVAAAPEGNFTWVEDEALSLMRCHGLFKLQRQNGPDLLAQSPVIATGQYPPSDPKVPGLCGSSRHYVSCPWSEDALDGLPAEGSVLRLGSGLTSMDLTATLKEKGFTGQILILSRHGLVPQSHRATNAWPEFWAQPWPLTVRGWTRLVRKEVKRASGAGCDWRAVIDALRPVTQTIWRRLPVEERRPFLRHVRSYWEVHRHRARPRLPT